MSGSRSFLQRTDDLKRLKVRALYLEDEYGVGPGPNTIPHFAPTGEMDFTNVKIIDGGDSVDIPGYLNVDGDVDVGGNLTVAGSISGFIDTSAATIGTLTATVATIQDLSANHIWTNTEVVATHLDVEGSASVLDKLSIGKPSGNYTLDISGNAYINSGGSSGGVFTSPGVYTITIPVSVGTISFEMIGAGGSPGFPGSIGGTGGYMRGSITGIAGQTLTIQVGTYDIGQSRPSTASYITIPGIGPLYAIVGAGGNAGISPGGINGGFGGGGTFSTFGAGMVANGGNGVDGPTAVNSAGRGGSSVGGAGGVGGFNLGAAGSNPSSSFIDAEGGLSGGGGAGGGGYAGGGTGSDAGGGGAGGGGSSFYTAATTTLIASYAGNVLPVGVLPGFGRSGQSGYVSISYAGQPSLQTTGDMVCGSNLDVCGNVNIDGAFSLKSFPVLRKVLISSTPYTGTTAAMINFTALFNTLSKIKIEINGSLNPISSPLPSFNEFLYWKLNGTTPVSPLPLCQVVNLNEPTLFLVRHVFELSSVNPYTTKLLNYGSYEARSATTAPVGDSVYHPTNLDLGSTTISSLTLTTSAGITASMTVNIYAYV